MPSVATRLVVRQSWHGAWYKRVYMWCLIIRGSRDVWIWWFCASSSFADYRLTATAVWLGYVVWNGTWGTQLFQKYAKTFYSPQAFRQKNRLKIALQVSKLGFKVSRWNHGPRFAVEHAHPSACSAPACTDLVLIINHSPTSEFTLYLRRLLFGCQLVLLVSARYDLTLNGPCMERVRCLALHHADHARQFPWPKTAVVRVQRSCAYRYKMTEQNRRREEGGRERERERGGGGGSQQR